MASRLGRRCGRITELPAGHDQLEGCHVTAIYRIGFDPSEGGGEGAVRETLEGVLICKCGG